MIFLLINLSLIAAEYDVSIYLGMEKEAKYKGEMDYPFGVDFDSKGNMFIVEYDGSAVDVLTKDGKFIKLGGDGTRNFAVANGKISGAKFNGLHNLIIDDKDNIYMTDTFNHLLRKYNHDTGIIENVVGSKLGYKDGPAKESLFNQLYCACWNNDKSKIYIADLKNQRVRIVDVKTWTVSTVAGSGKKGNPKDGTNALEAPFRDPRAVAVDSKGNLYIADRGGHALRVIKDGKVYTLVNKSGKKGRTLGDGPKAQLYGPKYLAIDSKDRVWIADDQNDRFCIYDPETKQLSSVIGKDSPIKGWSISRPHGLTIMKDGTIFLVDSGNNRILKMVEK